MRKLIHLFRAHPVLTPAFLLAAALTLLFTIRTVVFTIYWSNPAHKNQQIEPWMTPRYVAYSWDLPPEAVARALGLPEPDGPGPRLPRRSLQEISEQTGVPIAEMAARVEAAAESLREQPE